MAAGIGVKGCHWNWEAHEFPTNCSARTLATYFETHHCLLGWRKLSVWRDLPVICAYMSQTVGLKKFALHGVPGGVVQEPAFFPSNFSRRPSPTCPGIQEAGKGRLSMWHFPITEDTKRQTWWAAEDDLIPRGSIVVLWTRFAANGTVYFLAACFVETASFALQSARFRNNAHVFRAKARVRFEKQARRTALFVETTSKAHVWSL